MPRRLPAELGAGSISDVARPTAIRLLDQKAGNRIDAIVDVLTPHEHPVHKPMNAAGEVHFEFGVHVNEVDRPWSRGREHAEETAGREQRVETPHRSRA